MDAVPTQEVGKDEWSDKRAQSRADEVDDGCPGDGSPDVGATSRFGDWEGKVKHG